MTLTPPQQTTTWSALLLVLWGFVNCFFGYRWFKFVVTLVGIFFGAIGGMAGAAALVPGNPLLPWIGLVVGAVLGGLLAFSVALFALFLLGFSLGFVVTLTVAHFSKGVPVLLGAAVVGLILGLVGLALQRWLITASTAWSGAFWVALATAFFLYGLEPTQYLEQPGSLQVLLVQYPWVLVHTAVLGAIGFFVQLSGSGKTDKPAKAKK